MSTNPDPQHPTKPWQHGTPLPFLRAVTKRFAEYEQGLTYGAFTRIKETHVAAWIKDKTLSSSEEAIIIHSSTKTASTTKTYTKTPIRIPAETQKIIRWEGSSPEAIVDLADSVLDYDQPILLLAYQEHKDTPKLAARLGLDYLGSKIRASSEIIGIYGSKLQAAQEPEHDRWNIRIANTPANISLPEALAEMEAAGITYGKHYSSYDIRSSWEAVSLRSFGGTDGFIIKPAEMSKGWRAKNPEAEHLVPEWTPLGALLPQIRQAVEALGHPERVRLMKLRAGGGLGRHADITDRAAGLAEGEIMRLHLPLITTPEAIFTTWDQQGTSSTDHMPLGRWAYLDTRKPHAAQNTATSDRIHLVADFQATPDLIDMFR